MFAARPGPYRAISAKFLFFHINFSYIADWQFSRVPNLISRLRSWNGASFSSSIHFFSLSYHGNWGSDPGSIPTSLSHKKKKEMGGKSVRIPNMNNKSDKKSNRLKRSNCEIELQRTEKEIRLHGLFSSFIFAVSRCSIASMTSERGRLGKKNNGWVASISGSVGSCFGVAKAEKHDVWGSFIRANTILTGEFLAF